jgi:protein-L-isoaspartate(D-aspartate) O-methyltransferase
MEHLVNYLHQSGVIKSQRVQTAMKVVDRGRYVPPGLPPYEDRPQPIGDGQTISAPHMHGQALDLLEQYLRPGCHGLDIGCGSGYLTACMAELVRPAGKVTAIENRQSLVDLSYHNISRSNPDLLPIVHCAFGNGWTGEGFGEGLYDAIHVGAAAESIPDVLIRVLKCPGRMVIPVGPHWGSQTFLVVDKDEFGGITQTELMSVMYVPLEQSPRHRGL